MCLSQQPTVFLRLACDDGWGTPAQDERQSDRPATARRHGRCRGNACLQRLNPLVGTMKKSLNWSTLAVLGFCGSLFRALSFRGLKTRIRVASAASGSSIRTETTYRPRAWSLAWRSASFAGTHASTTLATLGRGFRAAPISRTYPLGARFELSSATLEKHSGTLTMTRLILAGATGWMLATRPELRERVIGVARNIFQRLSAR